MHYLTLGLLLTAPIVALAALIVGLPALLLWLRARKKSRNQHYDLLYSLNWGRATTNNYGFAPADSNDPERFQLQMYAELCKLVKDSNKTNRARLLEISCGRGGGLNHLFHLWGQRVHAIGIDFSMNALRFCQNHYACLGGISFACAHALHLPFNDETFDFVVNVEASKAYRDDAAFLREVHRVLKSDGVFLFADARSRRKAADLKVLVRDAGFSGGFVDITSNVVQACELDSQRRRALIRAGLPWYYRALLTRRLRQYAAIPGSNKFRRFRDRKQIYFLSCLAKLPQFDSPGPELRPALASALP
jgi:ubiquinone/menaquinone biosynthesis C-methylase UbiE